MKKHRTPPECECTVPNGGYCEKHRVHKNTHWVELCQTRADYRELWDCGRGPGQNGPIEETQAHTKRAKREQQILAELTPEFDQDLNALGVAVESEARRKSLWLEWVKAIKRWRKAGRPVRSSEQIQACLAVCTGDEHTPKCEHYDKRLGVLGYCRVCGCHVSGVLIGELNKIRMATEVCPKRKWG